MNNKIKLVSHRAFGFRTVEALRGRHLSLLRQAAAAGGKLITLLGEEPFIGASVIRVPYGTVMAGPVIIFTRIQWSL